MARNVKGTKRGWGWDAANQRLVLYVNGTAVEYFDVPKARTYYVDNLTGSSTNDGLSWDMAMDQVETAVAASETYRALQTNSYGSRNTIIVAGSSTAYTKITSAPFYVNIVGIGANPGSVALGQVIIGSSSDYGSDPGDHIGANWENLMFEYGGSGKYGFNCDVVIEDTFYNCSFMAVATGGAGGMYVATEMSGTQLERCRFTTSSGGTQPTYGYLNAAGTFSECEFVNCTFGTGSTSALQWATGGVGTVIRDNYFGGSYAMAEGILDTSAGGYALVVNNTFTAACTDAISRVATANTANNIQTGTATNS